MLEQYGYYNEYYPNQAMGVYNAYNQFDLDTTKLMSLGFIPAEIETLQYIIMCGGKVTPMALSSYGLDYETAQRIKYMYDIAIGKVGIESTDDLCKHLRKLFGKHRRIGIQDLILSKVSTVPRLAVIGGIPKGPYEIYNSKNYPLTERMYEVESISGSRITIKTKRKPVLKYGSEKKVYYVKNLDTGNTNYFLKDADIAKSAKKDDRYKVGTALEIKELKPDKQVVISVDKDYARVVNRFIVVGSLRRPEFHSGMVEIIAIEGTKIYVYATSIGNKEKVGYKGGTQRVYDYGYIPGEIGPKLMKAASELYKAVCGVFATTLPANTDFNILDIEQPEDDADGLEDGIEL